MGDLIVTLLFLILIFLLIRYRKIFVYQPKSLTFKEKLLIVITILITLVPSLLFWGMINYIAIILNPSDYWLNKAKKVVNYHIYTPSYIPNGRERISKFITKQNLYDLPNATKVFYDFPTKLIMKGQKSSPIILSQTSVDPNFDLKSFVNSHPSTSSSYTNEEIPFALSKNQIGYLRQDYSKQNEAFSPKYLYFLTNDDVLISISTATISRKEIIQFANSLK